MDKLVYADVLLPLAIPGTYTYGVHPDMKDLLSLGIRVEAPLRSKTYSGLVIRVHNEPPAHTPRMIVSVLDDQPILSEQQWEFWQWLASYYCAFPGEVMNVALPSGLKLSSETKFIFNTQSDLDEYHLNDDEYLVAEAISIQGELTLEIIQEILGKKTVYPIIKSLLSNGILYIKEELKQKFKVLKEDFIKASDSFYDNAEKAMALVTRSDNQSRALLSYYSLQKKLRHVPKKSVYEMAGVNTSVVRAIEKKGIWEIYQREVSRIGLSDEEEDIVLPPLSRDQEISIQEVRDAHQKGKVALLHGVTGSGKTRIYMELIEEVVQKGGQVLYLLPEIALTSQIVNRLKVQMGHGIFMFHSQINENQRVEIWNAARMKSGLYIGARSSLFLPFFNLRLIIIDEEHDSSYKQESPNPKYQARDAAIVLSKMVDAPVILGSATPSLESIHNASVGKYELIELHSRYGVSELPEIKMIDLKECYHKGLMRDGFSVELIEEIKKVLQKKEQVLLFQNRRGYSPVLRCSVCDWKAECTNCDVSLTYHQRFHELKCHYCGYRIKKPDSCPACGSDEIRMIGSGTEKIEEVLKIQIPEARVERFDYDTTRSKKNQERILAEFKNHQIDILVGTQMITKGFDFDNIALVGVINADSLLSYPDFRSTERSFQLLMQVSGRAGRREKKGKVFIQTFTVNHHVFREVIKADYEGFYKRELTERYQFNYPPHVHLLAVWFRHKDYQKVKRSARYFSEFLKPKIENRLLGPVDPPILRLRGKYQQVVYIKLEKSLTVLKKAKQWVMDARFEIRKDKDLRPVIISIDVDPY